MVALHKKIFNWMKNGRASLWGKLGEGLADFSFRDTLAGDSFLTEHKSDGSYIFFLTIERIHPRESRG